MSPAKETIVHENLVLSYDLEDEFGDSAAMLVENLSDGGMKVLEVVSGSDAESFVAKWRSAFEEQKPVILFRTPEQNTVVRETSLAIRYAIEEAQKGLRVAYVIPMMDRMTLVRMAEEILGPSCDESAIDLFGIQFSTGGFISFIHHREEAMYTKVFTYDLRIEDQKIEERKQARSQQREEVHVQELQEETEISPEESEEETQSVDDFEFQFD